ncbi:MAG: protease modulator HflK [Alphaproteobacteria bacterium]
MGQARNDDRHYGPRGGQGGGGNRQEPPDLDEMLRRAQENFREVMPGNLGGGAAIGLFLLAVVALWLASGFYIVNPGEHAVVQRFGAWSRTQTTGRSGLSFADTH